MGTGFTPETTAAVRHPLPYRESEADERELQARELGQHHLDYAERQHEHGL
jgi:hypothetical protein